jgi:hypothetical protein
MGLQRPRSRYEAEWLVGVALAAQPERYPELGLGVGVASDQQIARAIATWLADRHNGCSEEWRQEEQAAGREAAIERFVRRYLTCGPNGSHMIDRIRRALQDSGVRAGGREIPLTERERVMALSDPFGATARRYRYEVWTCAALRAIRSIVRHHTALGTDLSLRKHPDGGASVVVPIAAQWMESWPYGGGGGKGGQPMRYVEFRRVLTEAQVLVPEQPPVYPWKRCRDRDILPPGEATGYRAPLPVDGLKGVGIPWATIEAACLELKGKERVGPDEAYHILHLTSRAAAGTDLGSRYGRRTADRERRIAGALHRAFENAGAADRATNLEAVAGFADGDLAG